MFADRLLPFRRPLALVLALGTSVAAFTTVTAGPAFGTSARHKVSATLTEFHIALSTTTFAAGPYTFAAVDKGQVSHGLAITGPGLANNVTPILSPGQSASSRVPLRRGTYDVFCPVGNHKSIGMDVKITVKSGQASTAPAASTGTGTRIGSTGGGGSSGGYGY
jgi:plastocyanin